MKWFRFTIQTTTEAEDILVSDMYDIGLEGAQIEDKLPLTPLDRERMFVDIPPEPQEDDGVAYVSFFLEEPEDAEEAEELKNSTMEKIRTQLAETAEYCDIGSGELTFSETEDLDWINNWKQYFHSFSIDDILVLPSWEEGSVPEGHTGPVLHIDPGTAFGTGMHETTQLCIRQLRKFVNADTRLLDVGTGSGILGILALMFGAAEVTATDLDPCAVPAVEDNCNKNGIDTAKFSLIIGNIIDDPAVQEKVGEGYDIAVANILAEVLIPLMPELYKHVKAGGYVITSGIIEGRETAVAAAMEQAGFEVTDTQAQGEWRCVVGKKP
ncbi:MAG: 50S ribosomal protein L11 methyltransferase [Lachnospiraceae bacterium]|nr:50S ribosomal protein L11 methyltransferase [Lachnospiraceae bacterium]